MPYSGQVDVQEGLKRRESSERCQNTKRPVKLVAGVGNMMTEFEDQVRYMV